MIFSLNGREYTGLHITNYAVKLETLDGEGTGRAKSYGWPMIREPQGQITNLALEFAASNSQEPDFVHLWGVCKSMGNTEFARVEFVDPTGAVISQNMYLVASELKYKRITRGGTVFTDTLKVSFIAETGG